jgi:Lipase maturation factor
LVYLLAFSVVVNQFRPLCGENGLLPVGQFLRQTSFTESPSIFFMFPHDSAIAVCGWLGIALSVLAATGLSERFGDLVSMVVWTLLWLLFRVIFGAGLIKLRGDPCWRDFTCLDYHFETQPMPNSESNLSMTPLTMDEIISFRKNFSAASLSGSIYLL